MLHQDYISETFYDSESEYRLPHIWLLSPKYLLEMEKYLWEECWVDHCRFVDEIRQTLTTDEDDLLKIIFIENKIDYLELINLMRHVMGK